MNLTAENTAIVLDSTADLPDAADRFPNWRVVPLYVRFGDESLRDGVDIDPAEFYARLRESSVFPTTSQPTPGDFLACYEELGAYERIFSLHVSARVSGTFASAEAAAAELGDGRVRAIDTETASASIAMLALAIQRRLERGTSDEEVDALVERYRRERGLLFTVDTLEFLQRGGRIGKAAAFAGTLLQVKPILSIRDGEVEPVKRVRGERKAFAELAAALETETRGRAGATGSPSRTPPLRSGRPSSRRSCASGGRTPSSSWSSRSARSSAHTPVRARSRSSGSAMTTDGGVVNQRPFDGRADRGLGGCDCRRSRRRDGRAVRSLLPPHERRWTDGCCAWRRFRLDPRRLRRFAHRECRDLVLRSSRLRVSSPALLAGIGGLWVGVLPYVVLTAPSGRQLL